MIIFTSCRVERPYYETPIGKKKQDYYNKIQYGAKERPKRKFWSMRLCELCYERSSNMSSHLRVFIFTQLNQNIVRGFWV